MPPQSSKKSIFGFILDSQNHRFFDILATKMKMVFYNEKQEKITLTVTSLFPSRAKAQRPMAWLLVGGWGGLLPQKRQWPLARRISKQIYGVSE